ncbi:hypothetical protein [Streptomyces sp. NPDC018352]|uniref:hypothetical protein n=1 Tax=Streptomyces sp. NPDC018352 TaxID=3157194 RepID=UPI0033F355E4
MAAARRAGRSDITCGQFEQVRAAAACDGGRGVPAGVGHHDHPAGQVPHARVPGSAAQRVLAVGGQFLFVAGQHDDGPGLGSCQPLDGGDRQALGWGAGLLGAGEHVEEEARLGLGGDPYQGRMASGLLVDGFGTLGVVGDGVAPVDEFQGSGSRDCIARFRMSAVSAVQQLGQNDRVDRSVRATARAPPYQHAATPIPACWNPGRST